MATWNNDDLVLYHGCTEQSLRRNNPNGIAVDALPHRINLTVGGQRTEFGRGLYATTWIDQAKSWANLQAKKVSARNQGTPKAEIQDFNYRATKEAIARAVAGEPTPTYVVSQRNVAHFPFAPT